MGQQSSKQVWVAVHHGLNGLIQTRAAALNYIGCERPWTAHKSQDSCLFNTHTFLALLQDHVTNMALYMSAATSDHIQNTVAGNRDDFTAKLGKMQH